jgi:hypothetical protein
MLAQATVIGRAGAPAVVARFARLRCKSSAQLFQTGEAGCVPTLLSDETQTDDVVSISIRVISRNTDVHSFWNPGRLRDETPGRCIARTEGPSFGMAGRAPGVLAALHESAWV